MITLALDASTYAGSVAILRGKELVAQRVLPHASGPVQGTRAEGMMPAIASAMQEASLGPSALNRILCGEGPGSFTSLRIAASLAKGFAHSLGIPLYAVSSLLVVAAGEAATPRPVVAAIDAMRGEFHAADFQISAQGVTVTTLARIVGEEELQAHARKQDAILRVAGREGVSPKIGDVAPFLDELLERGPVDLASWEPAYGRLAEAQVRWEKVTGRPLTG